MRVFSFVCCVVGAWFCSTVSAQPYVPRLSTLSFTTPVARTSGDSVTVAFTLAPGSLSPAKVVFAFTNGSYNRTLTTTNVAGGSATTTVDANWPNGTYTLFSVAMYGADGSVYAIDRADGTSGYNYLPWLLDAPGAPLDSSGFAFTVFGGIATVTPVSLTAIARTSADSLAAGNSITYTIDATIGTAPAKALLSLASPDGNTTTQWSAEFVGNRATLAIPTATDWTNGQYTITALSLSDINTGVSYYPSDTAHLPATLNFRLTGGTDTPAPPSLASIAAGQPSTVHVGDTIDCQFSLGASSSGIQSVNFAFSEIAQADRAALSTSASSPATATVGTDWLPGTYTLTRITLWDTRGRIVFYNRDGTVTNLKPYTVYHSLNFAALDFTVADGLAIEPTIDTQPTGASITAGQSVTLSVHAHAPLGASYQWYTGASGNTAAPLANATTNSVSVTPSATTSYWVRVTAPGAAADSNAAVVTVTTVAPVILSNPTAVVAAVNTNVPLTGSASGTDPLSYQWYKDGAPIAGATQAQWVITGGQISDDGVYFLRVTNAAGSADTSAAAVSFEAPPQIVMAPASATVKVGATVTLSVSATGGGLGYQWLKDGATGVRGVSADGTTVTLDQVTTADAGGYQVRVSNTQGTVTSGTATVTVTSTVTPVITVPTALQATVGRPFTYMLVVSGNPTSYSATGLPSGLTIDRTGTISGTPTAAGSYGVTFSATNSAGTATASTTLTTVSAPAIASAPGNRSVYAGTSVDFVVQATGTAPLTYQWQKDGKDIAGATSASYTVPLPALTDAGDYTVVVSNQVGSVSATAHLTVDAYPVFPTVTTPPAAQAVNVGQTVTLSVQVSGGTAPITYTWYKDNTLVSGATSSTLTITNAQVYDNGSYAVLITNPAGVSGPAAVQVSVVPSAPFVLTPPKSSTTTVGQTITLSAVAVGAGTLAYQWNKDGAPIAGATSATLQLATATAGDSGNYTVVVSNANGTMTSDAARVSIGSGPGIAEQPQSQTVPIGGSVRLAANSNGSATAIQWKHNGVPIAGWTSEIESIGHAQLSDMGFYSCTLTNGSGITESRVATVSVVDGTAARPINVSTRAQVNPNEPLIAGFVLSTAKTVLVRAAGPALADYGVTGALSDPKLVVTPLGASSPVAVNDDWGTSANADVIRTTAAARGAFPFAAGSKDAAILIRLNAGAYTAQVDSADGSTGIALVEVYDAEDATSSGQLVNVSARSHVGSGDDVLVVGFVIDGTAPRQVLIRAVGPGLLPLGVATAIADPQLSIVPLGASYEIASNDNWGGGQSLKAAMKNVGAFGIDDASKDAALVVRLPPGAYSAVASGVGGATGTAIVEVYDIGP